MHRVLKNINYGIITVSTSRYKNLIENKSFTDESGKFLKDEFNAKVHLLVPDNEEMIIGAIKFIVEEYEDIDCIILTGGTGLAKKDITVEALKRLVEKEIEGFKILFCMLSFEDVGTRAMLSRAFAGIYKDKVIFSLPGSVNACKLGAKLIKKEIGHILGHVRE
ncbi:MogA/MoaB family molybdenum cofactor biosynthesis protein [Methanocaldococcus indicus]|uniref:MogA/MoaB family molybdenum cofactor biosynthesis protein n=1 Tax=Methanocaldococcus indicus TaxID=213231 RepID=UPI003C6D3C00